jgi:hypothetical protein
VSLGLPQLGEVGDAQAQPSLIQKLCYARHVVHGLSHRHKQLVRRELFRRLDHVLCVDCAAGEGSSHGRYIRCKAVHLTDNEPLAFAQGDDGVCRQVEQPNYLALVVVQGRLWLSQLALAVAGQEVQHRRETLAHTLPMDPHGLKA